MINYLFSGIDKEKGFNFEQARYLKKDINNNMKIAFIASTPDDYERNNRQLLQYTTFFNNIGINFSKTSIIDKRVDMNTAINDIEESDIVFLLGGSPELQMKFITEYDLECDIKNKKIVIGVSAGSMNQSKRVIYKDDFDNYKIKDYPGLGIADINIFPHFTLENESIVKETEEIKQIIPLILLPNDSFVRIKNGVVEIIGEYFK